MPNPTRSATNRSTGLAEPLRQVLIDVRRALQREVRKDRTLTPLSATQGELLRVVRDRPGIRVRALAEALYVAPNTVSTLVGRLVEDGLLRRDVDPDDARAARLHLTAAAQARSATRRSQMAEVLDAAVRTLDRGDQDALAAAVPALVRLTEALSTHADTSPAREPRR